MKLAENIDFTDTVMIPLGYDYILDFNGDLDGNGKTISGFDLVADIQYYGAISPQTGVAANLHDFIVNGTVSTAYTYCGSAVGALYGSMSNVTNRGTITSSNYNVGGVIGITYDGSVVSGCVNEGTVTSAGLYAGGVIGRCYLNSYVEDCGNRGSVVYTGTKNCMATGVIGECYYGNYIGCFNEGKISATDEAVGYLGGVVGYARPYWIDDTTTYPVNFINCYNISDITAYSNVAGVVVEGNSSSRFYMNGCYNSGNITATKSTSSGSATVGITRTCIVGSTYESCYNTGDISAAATYYTAGVFGKTPKTVSEDNPICIKSCYNIGNINSDSYYVGGVMAWITAYTTVDSCYNTGNVNAGLYDAGGIVGYLSGAGSSTVSNCWNIGDISVGGYNVGGIVGFSNAADSIYCCFNAGNITADSICVGGIAGYAASSINNVYSAGAITGSDYVGGVIGASDESASVNAAYVSGTISSQGSNAGNITGESLTTLSTTYFLSANAVECTDTVSVGLSYAELAKLDLGDDWTAGDNYTYPRITSIADNDYAKAYAAAVVPADGDSYSSITTGFNVGTPDGVTWTASPDVVAFDGNTATFTETVDGTVTLTAACGDVTVTTEITCDVEVEGINDVMGNTLEVVSEKFYTVGGAQVAEPSEDARAIYIVVKTYDDGTTEAVKEVR